MKIVLSGFRGENRALHPLDLQPTVGVSSVNQNPVRGDFRPWRAPLAVATVPAGRKTIYRMGRDIVSDTQYWLSWATDVYPVRAFIADDTTERTYYTGDGVPKWTDNTMALASAPYPTSFRLLGVPRPATPLQLLASGGVSVNMESRYYTYTYVTDKGEESRPAPVSLELICKQDDKVAISAIAAPPSGNYGINRTRIYRTQSGQQSDTEFFLMQEIASGLTTANDTNANVALNGILQSTTWLEPPADLSNLTAMWNGMMAGITGNAVRVCEAYKPYAWPLAYEIIPPNVKPVALATFGQALLVLTTGRPRLVAGSTPGGLDDQPLEISQACVSPRSAVSFGHGVAWACPDGLAYYGAGGAKMITAGVMTRDDWQAIKPETIIGTMYEGAYLGFYTVGGVTNGFLIDPLNPTGMYFTDIPGKAAFFDELQDQLYLLDGTDIKKWNAGALMTAAFKSKPFLSLTPLNMAAVKPVADAYPFTWKLSADGVLRHTQVFNDGSVQRLPGGYLAEQWQQEISSASGSVQMVVMATSVQELLA